MKAIQAFSSQFYDPNSKEPESPISSKNFLELVKAKMRVYGREAGFEFAEGFTVERNIGVDNLFHIL